VPGLLGFGIIPAQAHELPGAARFSRPKAGVPSFKFRQRARMRAALIGLLLGAVLARTASAYDAYDPANCNGADFDDKACLHRVEGDGPAARQLRQEPLRRRFYGRSLPGGDKACRKKVLSRNRRPRAVGRTQGDFTCVSLPVTAGEKADWANGWLPSAAADAGRPDAVAEDAGLDRPLVPSRRQHRNRAWSEAHSAFDLQPSAIAGPDFDAAAGWYQRPIQSGVFGDGIGGDGVSRRAGQPAVRPKSAFSPAVTGRRRR